MTPEGIWLNNCELFSGFFESSYRNILSTATPREFERGQVIFLQGQPISEVLLLTHGRVKITQGDSGGNEIILSLIVPGQIIGGLRKEKGNVCHSTAQAIDACEVLAWRTATFEAALESSPLLHRNTIRILERDLRDLERRFCELSTAEVSPRLAHALARLIDQIGHRVNGRNEINLSQKDLAQMVGTDAWNVNRLLSSWKRKGLISLRRNAIVIQNKEKLLGSHKKRHPPSAYHRA
jgi:CRP-like cAMP-binding protein